MKAAGKGSGLAEEIELIVADCREEITRAVRDYEKDIQGALVDLRKTLRKMNRPAS